jgi:co-chaperonin GroES (HSP10)
MKLLSDRMLVEMMERPKMSGMIHLPDQHHDFADGNFCRVLNVGPECKEVKKDDLVFFHSYHEGGVALPDGTKIIREKNVLLVIPQQPPNQNKQL